MSNMAVQMNYGEPSRGMPVASMTGPSMKL